MMMMLMIVLMIMMMMMMMMMMMNMMMTMNDEYACCYYCYNCGRNGLCLPGHLLADAQDTGADDGDEGEGDIADAGCDHEDAHN